MPVSPVYSKIRRSLVYSILVLGGAVVMAATVLVLQETAINASKDRNAQFHMPSILRSANAAKLILRSREQVLVEIEELEYELAGEAHTAHLQTASGFKPMQVIRNDVDRIVELHNTFGGNRYQATLDKVVKQYEQVSRPKTSPGQDVETSIQSMQDDLDRLDELYLSFNQLERLHTGAYEELDRLIENQVARRNLFGIPGSILILFGALAIIRYLALRTGEALEMQERADRELLALNKSLEQRIEKRTQSLSISRELYKSLFDNAPIAYYNLSPEGAFKRCNKAAERFFGVSASSLRGKNIMDFCSPESREKAQHMLARFSSGLDWQAEEMVYTTPDGETRYGLLSVAPIFDADGEVVESLSMDVDVSDLREAQDKVAAMQQELLVKERLAAIGQLTATVSHELRNPLGAIRGATDALQQLARGDNKETDRALALLERGQVRCDKIISDLLSYTRVHEMQNRNTDVDTWLAELIDDCDIPEEIDVQLRLGFQSELAFDRERLEQAVRNVLENACHAMKDEPADGRHQLVITTRQIDDRFELSIKDTGSGIEQDVQDKIFEPLFTTKSFGVGLGLPMIQRIMDQHNGGVSITGAPGQGTETILWLPISAPT